ncbi:MAG: alpha/beta hydrolase, partial [Pseudomonadota bacterium]
TSLPEAAQDNLWWLPARLLVRDQYRNAEKVGELPMPVLIQHGEADNLVSPAHGRQLAELAPKGEFKAFAGAGHALSFERRSQEARRDWILALDEAR